MHRRAQSPLRRKGSILNPASPRHPFAKPAVQPAAAALSRLPGAKPALLPTAAAFSRLPGAKPPVLPPAAALPRVPGAKPALLPPAAAFSRLPGAKPSVLPPPLLFPAFRVRNRRFYPRPRRFPASRVRNRPFCPRPLDFPSTPPSSPTSGPPMRRRPTPASPFSCLAPAPPPRPCFSLFSCLVPAPPLRPVFPSFPATPLQNVVAIPSLHTFRSVRSRCRRRDETAVFPGFCVVPVSEKGRDCCFSGILCGLGVGDGTRLLFFRDFVWSRCLRWDETAVFLRFCAVSVSEKGRDCFFPGF